MLHIALTVVQFFCAVAISGLVLLQRGKGAEAGAGFGAGASGTVFGARGAGTALSRATAIFMALFMVNSLALGWVGSHQTEQPKSIFDTAAETAPSPASSAPRIGEPVPVPGSSKRAASSPPAGAPATREGGATQPGAGAPAGGGAPGGAAPSSHGTSSAAPGAGSVPAPAPSAPAPK